MWNRDINFDRLPLYVSAGGFLIKHSGPVVGFFIEDEDTIKAINEGDPRILEALKWAVSQDAKDFCEAQWINSNLDDFSANRATYSDDYKERLTKLLANRYVSNTAKSMARQRLAKIAEREAKRYYTALRRKEFQNERGHLMLALIERDGYECAECGTYEDLTIDHIIPLSKGGTDDLSNLQLMCKSHNSQKGDRIPI